MKSLQKIAFLRIMLALLLSPAAAWPQQGANALKPDPAKVFAELIKPYKLIEDYAVTLRAKVLMPTVRIPDFSATIYFKRPDRFHIETKSFAPIPRNSGVFNPLQFDPAKNEITYVRSEILNQAQSDLYRVEPLDAKSQIRHYHLWIGGLPPRVLQVEYVSIKGTRGLVRLSHRAVSQGTESWMLPEKVHIHLTFPESPTPFEGSAFSTSDNPISGGMRRLDEISGEGDIDISYSDWKINTGLQDGLFKPQGGR